MSVIYLMLCMINMYIQANDDKEVKETKKRGRPAAKQGAPVKSDKVEKKIEKEGENGEPIAKRGRGRPKKGSQSKSKAKVSQKNIPYS